MGSRIKEGGRSYVKIEDYYPEVGNRVRSYDFVMKGEADASCYVEGTITAIVLADDYGNEFDCKRYRIEVDKRVWCNKEDDVIEYKVVYPPVNGTPCVMGGKTMAIQKGSA